jgi:hypothetical protein
MERTFGALPYIFILMISTCSIWWVPYGFIWMPAGGRLEFRRQKKAGHQLEKLWDQFF